MTMNHTEAIELLRTHVTWRRKWGRKEHTEFNRLTDAIEYAIMKLEQENTE